MSREADSVEDSVDDHTEDEARKASIRPDAWHFYREVLGSAKYFLAPMVDCSVLAFRLLCKRHGTQVGVCPMINCGIYACKDNGNFRRAAYETCAEDHPSIAQICGHDPDDMVRTALLLEAEGLCVAVDVNLGCPQRVAKRGSYGAFLAEHPDLVKTIVERLCKETHIPITCKIRVTDDDESTIAFARMLEEAGCSMLTVHGRTKEQTNPRACVANWDRIARVVESVNIPVIANGGIRTLEDARRCLAVTKAQGVMSGTGLLANPALFSGVDVDHCDLAKEFVDIVLSGIAHPVEARGLCLQILFSIVEKMPLMLQELTNVVTNEELYPVIDAIRRQRDNPGDDHSIEEQRKHLPWYPHDCDISVKPLDGFEFWKRLEVKPCYLNAKCRKMLHKKHESECVGDKGYLWWMIIGVGRNLLTQHGFTSFRESLEAEEWLCRPRVIYVCVADCERNRAIQEQRFLDLFFSPLSRCFNYDLK